MATNLYINLAASSPRSALVKSATNLQPSSVPDFVVGDNGRGFNVYLLDGVGGYDAGSGNASHSIKVGVGIEGAGPSAGTYTLTFGANTTSALAYNANAATVQAALEGLASIGSNNVQVSGTWPVFSVEFIGTLANTDVALISGDGDDLFPPSNIHITETRTGGGGVNETQLIRFQRQPVALQTSWSTITNGWTGSLSTNTPGAFALLGEERDYTSATLEVEWTDASSNVRTVLQAPCTVRHEVVGAATTAPNPLSGKLTIGSLETTDTTAANKIVGKLGVGVTPSYPLHVEKSTTATAADVLDYARLISTHSTTSSGALLRANQTVLQLDHTSGVSLSDATTGQNANLTFVYVADSGTTALVRGDRTLLQLPAGGAGATLTETRLREVGTLFQAACTATTVYGDYMDIPTGSATITNKWGYYQVTADAPNYWASPAGFGVTPVTSSFLKVGAATTSKSSLNIPTGTAPSSPNAGDIWHDSTDKNLQTYVAGINQCVPGVIFTQTATATVANTVTETTLFGTGSWSRVLPANFMSVYKTIRVRLLGLWSYNTTPGGALTLRVKFGSTTAQTVSWTPSGIFTDAGWELEAILTCRASGVSGTVYGQTLFESAGTGSTRQMSAATSTVTVDWTASQTIDVTAQWANADSALEIEATNAIIEVLN